MHKWKNPQGTRVYEKHGGAVETAHDHKKQRSKRDKFITKDMICEKLLSSVSEAWPNFPM